MNKIAFMLYLIVSLTAGACASSQTAAMLKDGVGRMTFDEAVSQLGQPLECTDYGRKKNCTWIRWKGRQYRPDSGVVQMAVSDDPPVAYLTFENNILSDWHLSGKWR